MKTVYQGRHIEIIPPVNPYGRCVFTVGGQGFHPGEPFHGEGGQSAAEVLRKVKDQIDATDRDGVRGSSTYTTWLRPGSWEICPLTKGRAHGEHVKPVDGPCLEDACIREAAGEVAAKERRAQAHPAVAALTTQLKAGGFTHHDDGRGLSEGFRVFKNEGDHTTGVRVVWYAKGQHIPMDAKPGRSAEISTFIASRGKYAVLYEGGADVYVASKTHGAFPAHA